MIGRVIVIGVWLVLCSVPARAQTAAEMLRACEIAQRGMHVDGTQVMLPPGADVNQCWGFMEAVQEYSTLADQDGKRLLGACPPDDGRVTDILRTFVAYARAHPETWQSPAAAVAFTAMVDAFPCQ